MLITTLVEAYRAVTVLSCLQLIETSRTLRQVSLRSLLSQMRETEASQNEVTSSVDDTARTRWTEFKPEQSGRLCSEKESVEKINSGVICF